MLSFLLNASNNIAMSENEISHSSKPSKTDRMLVAMPMAEFIYRQYKKQKTHEANKRDKMKEPTNHDKLEQ